MFKHKLAAATAACILLAFNGLLNAAEIRLVRFGPAGEEKPGIVDAQNQIHDLSAFIRCTRQSPNWGATYRNREDCCYWV